MAAATQTSHYDTIVLGAGMSGLACASRLHQHEYYRQKGRLLVLEARDRIGGRIGSVNVKGCRLDTGANWIHGVGTKDKRNPLMDILPHKKYREVGGRVAFRHPGDGGKSALSQGEVEGGEWVKVDASGNSSDSTGEDLVIPGNVAGTMAASLWGLIGSLHELAESASAAEAKRTTMLQAITQSQAFKDTFDSVPEEYHQTIGGTPQFVENMEAAPLTAQSAEQPQGHAGMSLLEFALDDFDGDQVFLRDGYIAIIDEVAKDLMAAGLVQTSKEVKQIRWDASPIEVETTSGTYTTKQVVCSLPLGVLQHHQTQSPAESSLFSPALPPEKRKAIESLGFGTLDKIFLVYSSPWWREEPYISTLKKGVADPSADDEPAISTDEDITLDSFSGFTNELSGIEIHRDGTIISGLRNLSIMNLEALTGFPILSCFVSCVNATQVEAMTDNQAGEMLHRALTNWLGREPPKPDAVHVTRWAQDEFSRGSYSHMLTDLSEVKHREEFQKPAGGLRFAGEHSSRNHFATVHGALLSGWREADAILDDSDARK
ncbi:hypothetical protein LTR17_010435 [Elasticomyces elasticus]|nr:hypothetical protein LTR17_010435 [Elasticomyces elasticus]